MAEPVFLLTIFIVVIALAFDYVNGFHDAANSIATVVSTRVLTPLQGVTGGWMLALFKIAILVFIFVRVQRIDLYAMQWSSMLILLFVAEGVVRAMSDAQPLAALGLAAALLATSYFVAVLLYLKPLKKAARAARD